MQTTYVSCIRTTELQRIVRQIASMIRPDIRFKPCAFVALHEIAEAYLKQKLSLANHASAHYNRITVQSKDLALVQKISKE